jgi:hypothetical protein
MIDFSCFWKLVKDLSQERKHQRCRGAKMRARSAGCRSATAAVTSAAKAFAAPGKRHQSTSSAQAWSHGAGRRQAHPQASLAAARERHFADFEPDPDELDRRDPGHFAFAAPPSPAQPDPDRHRLPRPFAAASIMPSGTLSGEPRCFQPPTFGHKPTK